ncbi:hypothetical protein [Mycolicibacterium llatzerense]|uniref:hypothetical protein n=1 Tax=Mycolicibacterium llatzerense TaxID=280871 RepID=UPI0021B62B39|nr:hypothetical protein [Mycolicibacterium llatzerense]MCT7361332.1 hypothetical protein [Mycolicibacterium llatzerense]
MNPTVGRIVHYQSYGTPGGEHPSEPVAAIVTAVHENDVDLCVFYPNGLSFKQHVRQAVDPLSVPDVTYSRSGHWNWPPR